MCRAVLGSRRRSRPRSPRRYATSARHIRSGASSALLALNEGQVEAEFADLVGPDVAGRDAVGVAVLGTGDTALVGREAGAVQAGVDRGAARAQRHRRRRAAVGLQRTEPRIAVGADARDVGAGP